MQVEDHGDYMVLFRDIDADTRHRVELRASATHSLEVTAMTQVRNASSGFDTIKTLSFVHMASLFLSWSLPPTLDATVGLAFASNGNGQTGSETVTFAVSEGGAPPAWLAVDKDTGALSGAAPLPGAFSATISATGRASQAERFRDVQINVVPPDDTLQAHNFLTASGPFTAALAVFLGGQVMSDVTQPRFMRFLGSAIAAAGSGFSPTLNQPHNALLVRARSTPERQTGVPAVIAETHAAAGGIGSLVLYIKAGKLCATVTAHAGRKITLEPSTESGWMSGDWCTCIVALLDGHASLWMDGHMLAGCKACDEGGARLRMDALEPSSIGAAMHVDVSQVYLANMGDALVDGFSQALHTRLRPHHLYSGAHASMPIRFGPKDEGGPEMVAEQGSILHAVFAMDAPAPCLVNIDNDSVSIGDHGISIAVRCNLHQSKGTLIAAYFEVEGSSSHSLSVFLDAEFGTLVDVHDRFDGKRWRGRNPQSAPVKQWNVYALSVDAQRARVFRGTELVAEVQHEASVIGGQIKRICVGNARHDLDTNPISGSVSHVRVYNTALASTAAIASLLYTFSPDADLPAVLGLPQERQALVSHTTSTHNAQQAASSLENAVRLMRFEAAPGEQIAPYHLDSLRDEWWVITDGTYSLRSGPQSLGPEFTFVVRARDTSAQQTDPPPADTRTLLHAAASNVALACDFSSAGVAFKFQEGSNDPVSLDPVAAPLSEEWTTVAMVVSATDFTAYVNGQLAGSGAHGGSLTSYAFDDIVLGSKTDKSQGFCGDIQRAIVYDLAAAGVDLVTVLTHVGIPEPPAALSSGTRVDWDSNARAPAQTAMLRSGAWGSEPLTFMHDPAALASPTAVISDGAHSVNFAYAASRRLLGMGDTLDSGAWTEADPSDRLMIGTTILVMQTDGNLVLYEDAENTRVAIWGIRNADYGNSAPPGTGPWRATLQSDGDFVVYDSTDTALWASGTNNFGEGPQYALVLYEDDVIVTMDGEMIWTARNGGYVGKSGSTIALPLADTSGHLLAEEELALGGSDGFSMFVRFKRNAATNWARLVAVRTSLILSSGIEIAFKALEDTMRARLYVEDNVQGTAVSCTAPVVAPGEWTSVALSVNVPALSLTLYVHGEEASSAALPSGWAFPSEPYAHKMVGFTSSYEPEYDVTELDATVSDVLMYKRALSATEVEDLHVTTSVRGNRMPLVSGAMGSVPLSLCKRDTGSAQVPGVAQSHSRRYAVMLGESSGGLQCWERLNLASSGSFTMAVRVRLVTGGAASEKCRLLAVRDAMGREIASLCLDPASMSVYLKGASDGSGAEASLTDAPTLAANRWITALASVAYPESGQGARVRLHVQGVEEEIDAVSASPAAPASETLTAYTSVQGSGAEVHVSDTLLWDRALFAPEMREVRAKLVFPGVVKYTLKYHRDDQGAEAKQTWIFYRKDSVNGKEVYQRIQNGDFDRVYSSKTRRLFRLVPRTGNDDNATFYRFTIATFTREDMAESRPFSQSTYNETFDFFFFKGLVDTETDACPAY